MKKLFFCRKGIIVLIFFCFLFSEKVYSILDFKVDLAFQNPTYLQEKDNFDLNKNDIFNCDYLREECRVNFNFEGTFNKNLKKGDFYCEINFGLESLTGEENKCNPNTITYPEGEYKVIVRIINKKDENFYGEISFRIINSSNNAVKKSQLEPSPLSKSQLEPSPLSKSQLEPSPLSKSQLELSPLTPLPKVEGDTKLIISLQGTIGQNKILSGNNLTCIDTCSVNFDARNSIGKFSEYFWDFGNQISHNGNNPNYIKYEKLGKYIVSLTAKDLEGNIFKEYFYINFIEKEKNKKNIVSNEITLEYLEGLEKNREDKNNIIEIKKFIEDENILFSSKNIISSLIFASSIIFFIINLNFNENGKKEMKTILITGALGYIGSHAVVALEEAGYKTILVDNLSNSCLETYRLIGKILGYKPKFYEADVRNFSSLDEIFSKDKIDLVIHFASLKAVGESCENPLLYFDNNIIGSIKLFEVMQKYSVKNIIFSSSASVYNIDNPIPYQEGYPIGNTNNPYGRTKYFIEKMLEDLALFSSFNVINLRYFNPIGAHSSSLIGEKQDGIPNNIFSYIMKVIQGELREISIFGNDYDTIDGTTISEYIDINDLIEGHIKAIKRIELLKNEKTKGFIETYNLGVGKGVSVLEFIKTTEKVLGKNIPYVFKERIDGDIGEFYCDSSKAKEKLNWEATRSLEDSIKSGLLFNGIK